jgi:predicted metal-dependent hydrolase
VESAAIRLTDQGWKDNEDYLYGIDLFNAEYWWEAHEVWERLWHLESPESPVALLLQGLIQLAAASLKENQGESRGADKLVRASLSKLRKLPDVYMGIDVRAIGGTTRRLVLIGM